MIVGIIGSDSETGRDLSFVRDEVNHESGTTLAEKRRKMISSRKYSKPSGRSAEEIDLEIKEMRDEGV